MYSFYFFSYKYFYFFDLQDKPYVLSHEEILQTVKSSVQNGIKEVHIVSAHNKDTGIDWYLDIFKKIKKDHPNIHVKALTAAEIHFLSQESSNFFSGVSCFRTLFDESAPFLFLIFLLIGY